MTTIKHVSGRFCRDTPTKEQQQNTSLAHSEQVDDPGGDEVDRRGRHIRPMHRPGVSVKPTFVLSPRDRGLRFEAQLLT